MGGYIYVQMYRNIYQAMGAVYVYIGILIKLYRSCICTGILNEAIMLCAIIYPVTTISIYMYYTHFKNNSNIILYNYSYSRLHLCSR